MAHSAAYQRFLDSMRIDYEKWHDGIGYDLSALAEMTEDERREIAVILAGASDDWRNSQALAALDNEPADASLETLLQSQDIDARLEAAEQLHAKGKLPDVDRVIAESLRQAESFGGLSRSLMLAEAHPTEPVKKALLWCALHADGVVAVNCVALLYYLAGLAKEAFDLNHRPFFLRFNTIDPRERNQAFEELCRNINVDPKTLPHRGGES